MQFGHARRCVPDSIVLAAKSSNARPRLAPKAAGSRPAASRRDRPTRATRLQVEAARRVHKDARSWCVLRGGDTPLLERDFLPLGSGAKLYGPAAQRVRWDKSVPDAREASARERTSANRNNRRKPV